MSELKEYREQLDEIDEKMFKLLCKRMQIAREIGEFKKENKLEIEDLDREKEVVDKRIEQSKLFNLDPEFIKKVYCEIFLQSKLEQKKTFENDN